VEKVLAYDAFRHKQVLGISAIEQEQIFTKAKSSVPAVEALLAWRGICDHNRIAFSALVYPCSGSGHYACDFVTKTCWCVTEE